MKNNSFPIDFVIPWVDGNDIEWQKEKNSYTTNKEQSVSVHSYDYKDWGLLKYFFRGIEKFAPWVNKVYFITWGHLPEWLNINNPKLVIVNHKDYIPSQYLPTFSSHVIELNLHRIEGLSEHFVYFNDDMYLTKPTSPEFFFKKGLPCDSAIINPIAPLNRNVISHLMLTTVAIINEHFNKHEVIRSNFFKWFNLKYAQLLSLNIIFTPWSRFPGILEKHVPTSFLKSTFVDVWNEEYDQLDETCKHRFRNFKTDVNQWIFKEWQIAKGNFSPRGINSSKLFSIYDMDDANKVKQVLLKKKYRMICINDHLDQDSSAEIMEEVTKGFEGILSTKSSFEK